MQCEPAAQSSDVVQTPDIEEPQLQPESASAEHAKTRTWNVRIGASSHARWAVESGQQPTTVHGWHVPVRLQPRPEPSPESQFETRHGAQVTHWFMLQKPTPGPETGHAVPSPWSTVLHESVPSL